MKTLKVLACPICGSELNKIDDKTLKCHNNHSFDIAKEGYVNLLCSNKTNPSGDDKQMVKARDAFLSNGYYDDLRQKISDVLVAHSKSNSIVLDCGCGTGYYTKYFQEKSNTNMFGLDISKEAVKMASKRDDNTSYIVGNAFKLPFVDNSLDVILSVFAPKSDSEYLRLLKKDGVLIEIAPGDVHLIELKEKLYGSNARLNELKDFFSNDFETLFIDKLTYSRVVKGADLMELVKMTPYFFKTNKESIESLNDIDSIDLTFSFMIKVYKVKK